MTCWRNILGWALWMPQWIKQTHTESTVFHDGYAGQAARAFFVLRIVEFFGKI